MGRPINNRFLGDFQGSIKVSHYRRYTGVEQIGDDNTYIKQQKSTNKFLIADTSDRWSEILTLVDKPAGALKNGEFRISARDVNGDHVHVSRFYNRTLRLSDDQGESQKSSWNINIPDNHDISGVLLENNELVKILIHNTDRISLGNFVTFRDIEGTTELNNIIYTTTNIIHNTSFQIDNTNNLQFTPYIRGGYVISTIKFTRIVDIILDGTNPVLVVIDNTEHIIPGDKVIFNNIVGTTQLNTNTYTIGDITSTNFTLSGTNSQEYSPYISDGTCTISGNTNIEDIILPGGLPVKILIDDTSNFSENDKVVFSNIGGSTELNTGSYVVGDIENNTSLTLKNTDSTTFSAFTNGGTIRRVKKATVDIQLS